MTPGRVATWRVGRVCVGTLFGRNEGRGLSLDLFLSNVTNRLDAKGRVSIPASFRSVLSRDGFEGLCVYPSMETEALDCGGHALLRDVESLLSPLPAMSETWAAFAATLYGQIEVLKVDGEGRVILSEPMKAHAGLKGEITFVGMGRKFQIWEPNRFQLYLAEAKGRVSTARKQIGAHAAGARE